MDRAMAIRTKHCKILERCRQPGLLPRQEVAGGGSHRCLLEDPRTRSLAQSRTLHIQVVRLARASPRAWHGQGSDRALVECEKIASGRLRFWKARHQEQLVGELTFLVGIAQTSRLSRSKKSAQGDSPVVICCENHATIVMAAVTIIRVSFDASGPSHDRSAFWVGKHRVNNCMMSHEPGCVCRNSRHEPGDKIDYFVPFE